MPYETQPENLSSSHDMNGRATWDIVLRIWWSMVWRYMLGVFGLMYVINFSLDMGFLAMGGDMAVSAKISHVLNYVVGILVSIVVVGSVLRGKFKTFRIVISPVEPTQNHAHNGCRAD